ncbi:hypothetical protein ABT330_32835 [Streptomyces sp. NPDC000658]|uniref:hypothetical protein n=1 Tax=Streptomyces sp. NPDC000658 TaxID=3154266 RepID=UPI00332076A8
MPQHLGAAEAEAGVGVGVALVMPKTRPGGLQRAAESAAEANWSLSFLDGQGLPIRDLASDVPVA